MSVTLNNEQVRELRAALDHAPSSLITDWMLRDVYGENPEPVTECEQRGFHAISYDDNGWGECVNCNTPFAPGES